MTPKKAGVAGKLAVLRAILSGKPRPQDASVHGIKPISRFSLNDAETLRLVLRGGSVVDWHRLNLEGIEDARRLIRVQELDPDDAEDRAYLRRIADEALGYLRRHFTFKFPAEIETATAEELMLMASKGAEREQLFACTVLKVMHVINHLGGRELLFRLPVSDRDLFHMVEEKVYRVVGTMLNEAFPVTEFIGGRKNPDSTYTKLLSKADATAAALYDKLRFRVVTRTRDDILPVLLYLSNHLFPFNYVVPGESTNTLFSFRAYCEQHPHLGPMVGSFQGSADAALKPTDNRFSAPSYKVIHFVADVPVRVPPHLMELAAEDRNKLGPIVFVLCEFQILDAQSDASNESGDASHAAYKLRQRDAVLQRLRLGAKPSSIPGPDPEGRG